MRLPPQCQVYNVLFYLSESLPMIICVFSLQSGIFLIFNVYKVWVLFFGILLIGILLLYFLLCVFKDQGLINGF